MRTISTKRFWVNFPITDYRLPTPVTITDVRHLEGAGLTYSNITC